MTGLFTRDNTTRALASGAFNGRLDVGGMAFPSSVRCAISTRIHEYRTTKAIGPLVLL